jgi:hypothetical protein
MVGKYDSLYVGGETYCCVNEVLPTLGEPIITTLRFRTEDDMVSEW